MNALNWAAVLVAAASGFIVGGIWYGPLFGSTWRMAVGLTEEQLKQRNVPMVFGLTFVLNVIASISLAMLLGPERTWISGVFYGAIAGLTFVSTALGITYLFERRPISQFLINAGYQTVNFATMGIILGAWH